MQEKGATKGKIFTKSTATYSTAAANCFSTDDGGMGSLVAAVRLSTEGNDSEA